MLKIIYVLVIWSIGIYGDTWSAIYKNQKNDLFGEQRYIGFKDENNIVKIKPIFMGFTHARKFDNIIAVMVENEVNQSKYLQYYLTKNGKEIGKSKDIMYMFDFTYDCENEGYIRFRDNGFTGLLDKNGDVSISPKYNSLTRVHNGLVIALYGAQKIQSGEHFFYKGGEFRLLNAKGKVLVNDIDDKKYTLDMYSLQILKSPSKEHYRRSYLGIDNKYYSFEIYTESFLNWMRKNIYTDLSLENILNHTDEHLKQKVKKGFKRLKYTLNQIKNNNKFYMSKSPILDYEKYQRYFNNCGQYREDQYPSLVFYLKNSRGTNDYISFLKDNNTYKLFSFSLEDKK